MRARPRRRAIFEGAARGLVSSARTARGTGWLVAGVFADRVDAEREIGEGESPKSENATRSAGVMPLRQKRISRVAIQLRRGMGSVWWVVWAQSPS